MAREQDQRHSVKNDGKDSESLFQDAMRKKGYAVFRLRDKRDLHGLNSRAVAAFGQPSDYVVVTPDGAYLGEVKSSHENTSFPFSCFTKAQASAMSQCAACSVGHNYKIYIHNLNENLWYYTTADTIVAAYKAGHKSLKWNQLILIGEI